MSKTYVCSPIKVDKEGNITSLPMPIRNDIQRAIESCTDRLSMYNKQLNTGVSEEHKEKLLRQIEIEELKIKALQFYNLYSDSA